MKPVGGAPAGAFLAGGDGDESIHFAAVDCLGGRPRGMWRPAVAVQMRDIRLVADARIGAGVANRRNTVAHRNSVGSGKSAEVMIERAILLHDDDHMMDLMNPLVTCRGLGRKRVRVHTRELTQGQRANTLR